MYLRRSCKLKLEVSLDEPLNVDWDGNELLLSDILGTDADAIYRGIEDEVDKELLSLAMKKLTPREKKIMELRFGLYGNREYTPEAGCRHDGNIPKLHKQAGKAHNQVAEVRDATDDVRRKKARYRALVFVRSPRHTPWKSMLHPVMRSPVALAAQEHISGTASAGMSVTRPHLSQRI